MGLWHSLSQQWSYIWRLCFGIERSVFSCSFVSTVRPDRGACIKARKGSALWQFTLFSCYYDGNAALFATAHAPERSLTLRKALTAQDRTAKQPVNNGMCFLSSRNSNAQPISHSFYSTFLPPSLPLLSLSNMYFLFFCLIKNWRVVILLLFVAFCVCLPGGWGPSEVFRRLWGLRKGNGRRKRGYFGV